MVITLLGVTVLTFGLTYIAPGDPVEMILEVGDTIVPPEIIEQTRREMGLDQPFYVQYWRWLTGILHGDMGLSYSAKMPVVDRMLLGAPGTLALAGAALFLMVVISVPLGILIAVHRNHTIDYVVRFLSFIGVSMPSFWVGLLLLYFFGLKLGLFPIAGGEVSFDRMVLPAVTLAIVLSLLIKVGEETYAISLENVEETILVRKENIKTVHGAPATILRGEVLSLSDLGEVLGADGIERDREEYPVVVVKIGKNKIGFIVSELIGQQEIVIKSLGSFLSKIDGITGGTILGDGNVALILDVASFYSTKG